MKTETTTAPAASAAFLRAASTGGAMIVRQLMADKTGPQDLLESATKAEGAVRRAHAAAIRLDKIAEGPGNFPGPGCYLNVQPHHDGSWSIVYASDSSRSSVRLHVCPRLGAMVEVTESDLWVPEESAGVVASARRRRIISGIPADDWMGSGEDHERWFSPRIPLTQTDNPQAYDDGPEKVW